MARFRPTLAPPGRLVRLGVVLDARNPDDRLVQVASMCDRVGIGAVWAPDRRRLALLAPAVQRANLGVTLGDQAEAAALFAELASLTGVDRERLELTLGGGAATGDGVATGAGGAAAAGPAGPGGARPRIAVEVGVDALAGGGLGGDVGPAPWLAVADDVVLTGTLEEVATGAAAVRRMAAGGGRDPATLGIAARLPVSVGRTVAEAWARWEAEPAFAGLDPAAGTAIFGTLEQCHEHVIALAHAGVTDLRCVLPNAADVHDVIAQLTAMTVGTVAKLVPGAPRSPAPPPPRGWGGRPRFPTGSPSRRR